MSARHSSIRFHANICKEYEPIINQRIISVVCECFGITLIELKSRRRDTKMVLARAFCYLLCREATNVSKRAIGQILERHHASVISSLRSVDKYFGSNDSVKWAYERMRAYIRSPHLGDPLEKVAEVLKKSVTPSAFYKAPKEPKKPAQVSRVRDSGYSYHGERQRELIASK